MDQVTSATIIHFVRHGAVENPQNLRYGRLPGFHLSPTGRHQVEQASLFFINRPITHIYSSPLERAQQTASLLGLAFPQVGISLDDRLLETKVISEEEGTPMQSGYRYPTHDSRDAESSPTMTRRVNRLVEDILITRRGQEVICTSHADVIAYFFSASVYETPSLHDPYPSYASIFSFVYDKLLLKQVWYTAQNE